MKKQYQTPSLTVMNIQVESLLGQANSIQSNAGIKGGNQGYNGDARSRESDWDWDE